VEGEDPAKASKPVPPAAAPGAEGTTPVPAAPRPRPAAPAPSAAAGEGGAPAAPRPAPAPRAPAGPSPAELAQRAEVPSVPLDRLKARYPEIAKTASFFSGVPIVSVPAASIAEVCRFLKEDPESRCTYLSNLHGTHYPDKKDKPFEIVYHLYSIDLAQWIELKIELAEGEAVPTVSTVWKTANWHEREAFDMLGITFAGHPDLTRILLPDDWRGHPLRKEYPLEGNPGDHKYYRS
jgi:NADH-quinone oxidoreductase subunit C